MEAGRDSVYELPQELDLALARDSVGVDAQDCPWADQRASAGGVCGWDPGDHADNEDMIARRRHEEEMRGYAERLRVLTERLAETEEAERRRLARELHDQVGQNLTALGLNLNMALTQLPPDAPEALRARLFDSLTLVEQTTERIRGVMADLRPSVLDDYGLVAALRWYGDQFATRAGLRVAVVGESFDPRLPARVENALFRIAQEALTNVAKHAQATAVTITVEATERAARLIVADDGIGFDAAHARGGGDHRGWGLLLMAERAEAVGGRCAITSRPRQGARVIVEMPREHHGLSGG
jgi:signal transduction histidine kinase